ncbi:MAG: hypothetical protein A2Y24_08030 [Clostridiales bacterium GWE2_32_10]|nr:MAG: hypothetical protein A2Y24_08030 [Clostridiales bacterium GWE2_32_10]HBY20937.1 hypothetical protein [Clostridiales bacterium]
MKRSFRFITLCLLLLGVVFASNVYADDDETSVVYDRGFDDGAEIGEIDANEKAALKYENGDTSNWDKVIDSRSELYEKYDMNDYASDYKRGFYDGYKEKFEEIYIDAYYDLVVEGMKGTGKTTETTETDGANVAEVVKEEQPQSQLVTVDGATIYSEDKMLTIDVPKGTVYLQNYMYIKTSDKIESIHAEKKEIISNIYEIYFESSTKLYNNVTVNFKYYGSENVGIYRLGANNKLEYIPTTLEDGSLKVTIKKGMFESLKFVVCLDSQIPGDLIGHWAREEFITFLRRGFISPNIYNNVAPDGFITREQFVYIVDDMFKLYDSEILKVIPKVTIDSFVDKDQVSEYAKSSMERLLTLKYINGYGNNILMPHRLISYQEVETILRRVTLDDTIDWQTVREQIMLERGILPNMASKDTSAIKSEVLYLLNKYLD